MGSEMCIRDRPWAVLLTGLVPPLAEPISDHIGHRLDCALRSALILGVFGLGGLGTDLSLSLRSLQFQELWSGLWLLAIAIVVLDRLLRTLRNWSRTLILLVAMAGPLGRPRLGNTAGSTADLATG